MNIIKLEKMFKSCFNTIRKYIEEKIGRPDSLVGYYCFSNFMSVSFYQRKYISLKEGNCSESDTYLGHKSMLVFNEI